MSYLFYLNYVFWIGFSGDDDEIPQELLLGKHQLNELGSESAKIKAMGIMDKVSQVKFINLLTISCLKLKF